MRTRSTAVLFTVGSLFLLVRCGGTTTPGTDGGASTDASTSDGGGKSDGGSGGSCNPACGEARNCCGNACVNEANDPHNCGGCGVVCSGTDSFCEQGTCKPPPCTIGTCNAASCCGSSCCSSGEICCATEGPVSGEPTCFKPTADQPTCPQGCAPLCVSDREAKTNVTPVSDRAVLDALASVPMSTWSYKTDDPSVRHLGPMAQDLHQAFGLGGTDKAYDPVDAHGIAFASVKALYEMAQEQDRRIRKLEEENARLEKACAKPAAAR